MVTVTPGIEQKEAQEAMWRPMCMSHAPWKERWTAPLPLQLVHDARDATHILVVGDIPDYCNPSHRQ